MGAVIGREGANRSKVASVLRIVLSRPVSPRDQTLLRAVASLAAFQGEGAADRVA